MIYNRQNLLGLKLKHAVELRKLTRPEFFSRMQVMKVVDEFTDAAFEKSEHQAWQNQEDDSPHGHPWHVSFHASQFPGDSTMACPRQSLYRMMDFAPPQPHSRRMRAIMTAGKAIEEELVRTWHRAGILISAPPGEIQTGFEIRDAWLTGSVDAVLLPVGWKKPLPVEVKSKYADVIRQMQVGLKGPDPAHIAQIKVELALIHFFQHELWPDLEPVTHGYIYYVSRDKPDDTAEFRVDYDERWFEYGIERLKQWRGWFQESYLPSINPSKKHPMGWRWSYQPCQWCDFKKTCQLDHREGVTDLMDSIGIARAQRMRPHYDPEAARLRVRARWQDKPADDTISVRDPRAA